LVEEGYNTAKKILTKNKRDLDTLAQGLIDYETLSGDEIKDLLEGKIPTRDY
jgi:cell division protease FtsH